MSGDHKAGALPKTILQAGSGKPLAIQVLKSAAGFYIGTLTPEGEPNTRESTEYWGKKPAADAALERGGWTARRHLNPPPVEFTGGFAGTPVYGAADDLVRGARSTSGTPPKNAGSAMAKNDDGIAGSAIDLERVDRVVQRLAARASTAAGEYVQYFADRRDLARLWQDDLSRGVPLTPDRREGLLDMECTADPQLGGKPYRIHVSKGGRLEEVNLRVLKGKAGYFIGAAGGADGPAYSRLSREIWTGHLPAETALKRNAWTSAQQNKSQRRGR